jgi:hypothetical protein
MDAVLEVKCRKQKTMKTTMILMVLCVCAMAQPIDPFADPTSNQGREKNPRSEKTFEVSKANSSQASKERFLKLWDALQSPRFKAGAEYQVFTIRQAVGKVGTMQRYLTDDVAVVLEDNNLHEKSFVALWVNPDGVYDFTTVARGLRRVPQFVEAVATPDPNAPTREEFLKALRRGETFAVRIMEKAGCRPCFGKGKTSALSGGKVCTECYGTGDVLDTWILKW